MVINKKIVVVFAILFLQACASVQAPLDITEKVNTNKAYVYGNFESSSQSNVAFAIGFKESLEDVPDIDKQIYYIKFEPESKVNIISLPPGKYDVNKVTVLTNGGFGNQAVVDRRLFSKYDTPIVLDFKPGVAYYMGDIKGFASRVNNGGYPTYTITTRWKMEDLYNNFEGSTDKMKETFSNFKDIETYNAFADLLNEVDRLSGYEPSSGKLPLADLFKKKGVLSAPDIKSYDGYWIGSPNGDKTGDCSHAQVTRLGLKIASGSVTAFINDGESKSLKGFVLKGVIFGASPKDIKEPRYTFLGKPQGNNLALNLESGTCKSQWLLRQE